MATLSIRMYRGLLGDCFLLTQEAQGKTFRALIDCGVLMCIGADKPETELGREHILKVVKDLKSAVSSAEQPRGALDLVIATHEHYDHLSGFMLGFDHLKDIEIKALWLAWTEKRGDPEADAFRNKTKSALRALKMASGMARLAGRRGMARSSEAIDNLLQFYGEIDDKAAEAPMAAAGKSSGPPADPLTRRPNSCSATLNWLKLKAQDINVRYLEPGEAIEFGLSACRLKAHVLGPPRALARLKQMDPSPGSQREVYLTSIDDVTALQSVLKLQDGAEPVSIEDTPFSEHFEWAGRGRPDYETAKLYYANNQEAKERLIDDEWLGSAETLALKIDGDVNNTSLALAIEIPGERMLLFPGDAQVGNWLSWTDQTYPKAPAKTGEPVRTIGDILRRVILYKVGHHGSHNATLRKLGLDLMTSPHLAAMIPVVETVAREQVSKNNPKGWSMPYPDLHTQLNEKTQGRIIRGDGDPVAERQAFTAANSPFALRYSDDSHAPLWTELSLALGD